MAEQTTVITYDIDEALAALEKLSNAVKGAADTADSSFKSAGGSSSQFQAVLGELSPAASGVLSRFQSLVSAGLTPFGVAGAAAGATVAALAAQFFNLPQILKDSTAEIDRLNKALDQTTQRRIDFGDIGDARKFREFEDRARGRQEKLATNIQTQADLADQKAVLVSLKQQIEARIDAAKAAGQASEAFLKSGERELNLLERQIQSINAKNKAISVENKRIRVEGRQDDLALRQAKDQDKADEAAQQRSNELEKINNLLNTQRTTLQQIKDLGKGSATALFGAGGQELQAQIKILNEAKSIANEISTAFKGGQSFIDENQLASLERLQTLVDVLKRPGASGAISFDVGNLEKFLQTSNSIAQFDKEFAEAGRGAAEQIKEGSNAAAKMSQELEKSAKASKEIKPTFNQPPGFSVNAGNVERFLQTANAPAAASSQVINVNANVKGGIIDAETTRTITDIIRRELRKGTSPQSGA